MRVLYVENDPADADLARRWLARRAPHIALDVVSTRADALLRLVREMPPPFDIVLTDLDLPDGSGLDLLLRIRLDAFPVAVVVITGRGDEETAVAALRSGADDYIVKHRDYLERLPLALERALHRHRAEASRRGRPIAVLYAEHDEADVDLTRRHFARHAPHIRMDVVTTGPAILDRVRDGSSAYDVLLLDYRLPAINGLDVLDALQRDRGLDVPVVIVTGQGDQDVALQALERGAAGYVIKMPGYLYRLPVEIENAYIRAGLLRERAALRASQEQLRRAEAILLQDANDRKAAEAALHASEARNLAILRALPDLVFLQSPDGVYLDHHVGNAHGVTVPQETFRRRPTEEVLPRSLAREFLAQFNAAGRPGEPQVHQYALRMDGALTHFEARLVGTDDGNILTLIRNVTEQVRTTEALRDSNRRIADLAGRLIAAQEEERARIARELHDDLGQRIAALTARLTLMRRHLPGGADHPAARELSLVEHDARAVADHIRQLSHDLHPAVLQHIGLAAAVRAFCGELCDQSAFVVEAQLEEPLTGLPPQTELCLYRVVQECLRNALRHSGAPRALVTLRRIDGQVELCVTDDGVGFDTHQPRKGLGLVSLEERVRLCDGRLRIDARPGGGTRVIVNVPAAAPSL